MGQDFRSSLARWVFFGVFPKASVKILARVAAFSRLTWEDLILSSLRWLSAAFSSLAQCCLVSMAAGFPLGNAIQEIMRERGAQDKSFYSLISEVASYHVSCILFIRSKSQSSAYTQRKGLTQKCE